MANLFDILPRGFFNYLGSSANNRVYADCLELIYEAYDREVSYRIPRSTLRDILAAYLMDNHIELREEGEEGLDKYQMASAILRRFTDPNVHWLEEESDDATYEKQIVMSEHGIALAEFLLSLRRPEKEEYAGYIIQIYLLLNNPELLREEPYVNVLRPVHRNAKLLARSLKRLSTFIRDIIEEMVHEESLESITENLIAYCEGSFIREYTRLIRQQNIHTYRALVREKLESMRTDTELMERMTASLMAEEGMGRIAAEDQILDMISSTIRFLYTDYDQIMSDIRHKINLYMQLHIGHLRYLQNRDSHMRGHVQQAMRLLTEEFEALDMKDELPEDMNALFRMGGVRYVDTTSIKAKARQRRVTETEDETIEAMTAEDLALARGQQMHEAANPYSQKHMRAYLDTCFAGRDRLSAGDLPLDTPEDLLRGLSAIAYADQNGYTVEPGDTYVETGRLILRNFELRRKP